MTVTVQRPSGMRPPPAVDMRSWALPYPRLAATTAGAVGMLVTAFGGGLALRYLSKAGASWTAVFGLLALGSGLCLLAYAWTAFWRRAHRWQRLWFVPAVLTALLTMLSVAQGTMLAIAPRNDLGRLTPAANGLAFSDVSFRSTDGVRLSAWWIPSRNYAAVVTVPGAGSTRLGTLGQATVLARHGYGVLMMDPRGQGRSGGHAMDAGWFGDRDVPAAVRFVQRQAGVDPTRIGVLGLSMGGEEAIGAAAVAPEIRAVVAEGATSRTAADKAGFLPGGVGGAVQRGLDWATYGTAATLSRAPQPPTLHGAIARSGTTEFLLIAGGSTEDEARATAYLRSAAPGRVLTWTVPRSGHVQGLETARDRWTERVTSFLDAALAVSP